MNLGPLELLLLFGGMAVWIWALVECIRYEPEYGTTKVVWLLLILMTYLIGALLYLLLRRPQRMRAIGR